MDNFIQRNLFIIVIVLAFIAIILGARSGYNRQRENNIQKCILSFDMPYDQCEFFIDHGRTPNQ